MRPMIRWIAPFTLSILFLSGSLVEAQKKVDPDKDAEKSGEKSADKFVKVATVTGKVMAVYEDKKKVRVQLAMTVPNPQGLQAVLSAQRAMATANNPQAAYQAQLQLARAQQGMYKVENKDVEIQAADTVVVRRLKPKEDFDEKGKQKKYTKKEKLELRGPDKKLPGYMAEFGDISTDQYIQLTLVRKKGAHLIKAPRRRKTKDKDADAAAEADLLAENAPQASLIVIVQEPRPGK